MKNTSAKGIVRWNAVGPVTIVLATVALYVTLFFDGHARRLLEYVGTRVNGAEVNVALLRTSVRHLTVEIAGVQVTDRFKPARNLVEVGAMRFGLLWDALLRGKLVVEDASVLDVRALSPRPSPGYVVPPSPPSKGPSALERVEDQVLAQTKAQYRDNFLGDVASVLGGREPKDQLKDLQLNLKSDQRLKDLERDFNEKKTRWAERAKQLPQAADFKALEARVTRLKFDFKNPAELARAVKEADQIRKEVAGKVKQIEDARHELSQQVGAGVASLTELDQLIRQDVSDLRARLKLPRLDAKEFSTQLFMALLEKRLGALAKYVELGRRWMPTETPGGANARAEQVVPPKRGQGRVVQFPVTTGYPLFWLKHAAFSSELGQSELSGDVKGELRDVTSDPRYLGRPAVVDLKGDFPHQGVAGLNVHLILDHTKDVPRETVRVAVARFPVAEQPLTRGADVSLGLTSAAVASQLDATFTGGELTAELRNSFTDVRYDFQAKNKVVREIIDGVLKGIPTVNVTAGVRGTLASLSLNVNSNLGDQLAKGFEAQLRTKVAAAEAELNRLVNARLGEGRAKLESELKGSLGAVGTQLDQAQGQAGQVLREAEGAGPGKPGGDLRDAGKKLLKGFGF